MAPKVDLRRALLFEARKCFISLKSLLVSRKVLNYSAWCLLIGATIVMYYSYLIKLYMIDEIAEFESLRELELIEKTTIFVSAPKRLDDLKSFVHYYSICPAVYEIVILWDDDYSNQQSIASTNTVPSLRIFKFTKTHSLVRFVTRSTEKYSHPLFHLSKIDTTGTAYLKPS